MKSCMVMFFLATQPISMHLSDFIICLNLLIFWLYSFTLLSGAQKSFLLYFNYIGLCKWSKKWKCLFNFKEEYAAQIFPCKSILEKHFFENSAYFKKFKFSFIFSDNNKTFSYYEFNKKDFFHPRKDEIALPLYVAIIFLHFSSHTHSCL